MTFSLGTVANGATQLSIPRITTFCPAPDTMKAKRTYYTKDLKVSYHLPLYISRLGGRVVLFLILS